MQSKRSAGERIQRLDGQRGTIRETLEDAWGIYYRVRWDRDWQQGGPSTPFATPEDVRP